MAVLSNKSGPFEFECVCMLSIAKAWWSRKILLWFIHISVRNYLYYSVSIDHCLTYYVEHLTALLEYMKCSVVQTS